jgi:membrane protease YdiL (CAAX protease family)
MLDRQFPSTDLDPETEITPPRKERFIEVTVFLFLIVPSMLLSFFAVRSGAVSFSFVALSTIFRDLGLMFLVLFLSWRDREPFGRLGWNFHHWPIEVIWGILLFVPVYYTAGILQPILEQIGLSSPHTPTPSFLEATGMSEIILATVLVVVVAISEETLFRGYLILRFTQITKNRSVAVIISTVIFALGHGYEGSAGVVTVGVIGLLLSVVYIWRRSLVAPMVIHFIIDFVGIVLVPLLLKK